MKTNASALLEYSKTTRTRKKEKKEEGTSIFIMESDRAREMVIDVYSLLSHVVP